MGQPTVQRKLPARPDNLALTSQTLLKPSEAVTDSPASTPASQPPPDATIKFRDLFTDLSTVYPQQQMAEISTSYCFIALLHLANEKGLSITNEEGFTDLSIKRDHTFEESEVMDA